MKNEKLKKGLGKGLSALVDEQVLEAASGEISGKVLMVPVAKIIPSRHQPRKEFNETHLAELSESIAKHGVIQPLVVSDLGDGQYELIAGERRLRASRLAGLREVPVVLREFAEKDRLAVAIIENVQRADLNAMEVAEGYKQMMDELGASQEEIAALVGKSRVSVANTLRLLKLPLDIRGLIAKGKISEGHGRALLGLEQMFHAPRIAQEIVQHDYSVRQTEELVRKCNIIQPPLKEPTPPEETPSRKKDDKLKVLEDRLVRDLGLKVEFQGSVDNGMIKVFYYTREDLENFLKNFPPKE